MARPKTFSILKASNYLLDEIEKRVRNLWVADISISLISEGDFKFRKAKISLTYKRRVMSVMTNLDDLDSSDVEIDRIFKEFEARILLIEDLRQKKLNYSD